MRYVRLMLLPLVLVACSDTGAHLADPSDTPLFKRQGAARSNAMYDVGFTSFVITDATRDDRPIALYVWYPADPAGIDETTPEALYPLDPFFGGLPPATSSAFEKYGLDGAFQEPSPAAGPFPLVMFSPGWGAAAYWHMDVGTSLAQHGFVVAAMTHYGDATTFNPAEPQDPLAVASYNRPRDVSAALDAVLAMDFLDGVIDESMIVASGWSLGGYASMVLAAGDDEVCDLIPLGDIPAWTCAPSFPDPRITMIITLDGSNQLLHFDELARVTVPAMGIGQEWNTTGSWQARQHAAFLGHPSYRVDVNRSIHQSFSTLCETLQVWGDYGLLPPPAVDFFLAMFCGPDIIEPSEAHRLVAKYMLAMLTHQQNVLTPGYAITSEPDIEFFVTEKRNPRSIDEDWPGMFIYHMHQPGKSTSNAQKELTAMAEKDPMGRPSVEQFSITR